MKWVIKLLQKFPTKRFQALILYLLFGPVMKVNYQGLRLEWIMWDEPTNQMDFSDSYQDLGAALDSLFSMGFLDFRLMNSLLVNPNDRTESWTDQVQWLDTKRPNHLVTCGNIFIFRVLLSCYFTCPKKVENGTWCSSSQVEFWQLRKSLGFYLSFCLLPHIEILRLKRSTLWWDSAMIELLQIGRRPSLNPFGTSLPVIWWYILN